MLKKKPKIQAPKIPNRGGYQVQDVWFHRAKAAGYRARSAFKLLQIHEKYQIIRPDAAVLDLGCAPGSWLQVLVRHIGENGLILGVDLQPVDKFAQKNIDTLVGDMTDPQIQRSIREFFTQKGIRGCDLITSDVAPKTSGRNDDDQFHSALLCLKVLDVAQKVLVTNGHLVMKVFIGRDIACVFEKAKKMFKVVHQCKPVACRDRSFEAYIVCMNKR